MYFNQRGIAKILMGICKGKKAHDKREALKQRDTQRGLDRAMRSRQ
jgi:SsrA-binding protein